MYYIGIDIGSTAAKVAVLGEPGIIDTFTLPTGWSGKETSESIRLQLEQKGYRNPLQTALSKGTIPESDMVSRTAATGYGRICVEYADKIVTEITCHGRGGWALFEESCTIIDVGGQDTKIITIENGTVRDFLMNDKCAAGTGKFLEIMAARLGVDLTELFSLAVTGNPLSISSLCTVFAESEVISHIGSGEKREDIASGVVDSVASKVAALAQRHGLCDSVILTGGLCDSPCFLAFLSKKLKQPVKTHPLARYAGAIGAAVTAMDQSQCSFSLKQEHTF